MKKSIIRILTLAFVICMTVLSTSHVFAGSPGVWESSATPNSTMINVDMLSADESGSYIVYIDKSDNNKVNVSKKLGTFPDSWVNLGAGLPIQDSSMVDSLAIEVYSSWQQSGLTEIPYVAFNDPEFNNKASVMKYDSVLEKWELLGDGGFSSGGLDNDGLSMKVVNGVPYVLCKIYGSLKLYKYENAVWSEVGTADISGVSVFDLSIDRTGTPYIAYIDSMNKLGIKYYKDNQWSDLQPPYFQEIMTAKDFSFKMINGNAYVAYLDGGGWVNILKGNSQSGWDRTQLNGYYSSISKIADGPVLLATDGSKLKVLKENNRWDADEYDTLAGISGVDNLNIGSNGRYIANTEYTQANPGNSTSVVRQFREYSTNSALFDVMVIPDAKAENSKIMNYVNPYTLTGEVGVPSVTTKIELLIRPSDSRAVVSFGVDDEYEMITPVLENGQWVFRKTIDDFTEETYDYQIKLVSEAASEIANSPYPTSIYNLTIAKMNSYTFNIKNIYKEGNKFDADMTFSLSDFSNAIIQKDVINPVTLKKIKIVKLPNKGTLCFNGIDILTKDYEINSNDISKLSYKAENDWSGNTSFMWKAVDEKDSPSNSRFVNISITPNKAEDDAEVALSKLSVENFKYSDIAVAENAKNLVDIALDTQTQLHVPDETYIDGIGILETLKPVIADLKKQKSDAIAAAEASISMLPAIDALRIEDETLLIQSFKLLNAAISKAAVASEVTGAGNLNSFQTKIQQLKQQKRVNSSDTAIAAINNIPVITEFTNDNVQEFEDKIVLAKDAVAFALNNYAILSDISNYTNLTDAVGKISLYRAEVIKAEKIKAEIKKADDAILALPELANLKLSDYINVAAARVIVRETILKGVTEGNITQINKLIALEQKLVQLKSSLSVEEKMQNYILAAIDVIDKIHLPENFTEVDREFVIVAEAAINSAIQNGAKESDITNIGHLKAMQDKIILIDKEVNRKKLIDEAIDEIDRLPAPDSFFTYQTAALEKARLKVEEILSNEEYGTITDIEITNLDKLVELEEKYKTIIRNSIIARIEEKISNLTKPVMGITKDFGVKLDNIYTEIKSAKFFDVKEEDINSELLAKFKALLLEKVSNTLILDLDEDIWNLWAYNILYNQNILQTNQLKSEADALQNRYEEIKSEYGFEDSAFSNLSKLTLFRKNVDGHIVNLGIVEEISTLYSTINSLKLTYLDINNIDRIRKLFNSVNNRLNAALIKDKDTIMNLTKKIERESNYELLKSEEARMYEIGKQIITLSDKVDLEISKIEVAGFEEHTRKVIEIVTKYADDITIKVKNADKMIEMQKVLRYFNFGRSDEFYKAKDKAFSLESLLNYIKKADRMLLEDALYSLVDVKDYQAYGYDDEVIVQIRKDVKAFCKKYLINESEIANIQKLIDLETDRKKQKDAWDRIISQISYLPTEQAKVSEYHAKIVKTLKDLIAEKNEIFKYEQNKTIEKNMNLFSFYNRYTWVAKYAQKFDPESKTLIDKYESLYKKMLPIYEKYDKDKNFDGINRADIIACKSAEAVMKKIDELDLDKILDFEKQNKYIKMYRMVNLYTYYDDLNNAQIVRDINSATDKILDFAGFTFHPNLPKFEQEAELDYAKEVLNELKYGMDCVEEMLNGKDDEERNSISNYSKYEEAKKKLTELRKIVKEGAKAVNTEYKKFTFAQWDSLIKELNSTPGGAMFSISNYLESSDDWRGFYSNYIDSGGRDEFYRGTTSEMKATFYAELDGDVQRGRYPECRQALIEVAKTDNSGKYDDIIDEMGGDIADVFGSLASGDFGDAIFGGIAGGIKAGINAGKANK